MDKSKLQELCHKNKWALPIYSGMQDGSVHNPQFKASVVVNGTNFDTINICKSLKEAYNEAAKLAFFHFSSGESIYGGPNIEQAVKTMATDSKSQIIQDIHELACEGTQDEEAVKGGSTTENASSFEDGKIIGSFSASAEIDAEEQKSSQIHLNSLEMEHDLKQKFKTKLQIYAQRYYLGLPLYQSTREGPPNSICFRTTVTVGGDSFNSPVSYKTIKQAEEAAAQVALMTLSTDAFQENDIRLYKNLLQEFARSEGFFMPQYKTTRTGEVHDPTFNATVEVEGETFHGNPAKSKKQAELSAAKVAYTNFMLRKCFQTVDLSPSSLEDEIIKLAPGTSSQIFANMKESPKSRCPMISTSTAKYEAQMEASKNEDEEAILNKNIPENTEFKTKKNILVSACKVADSSTMKMASDIKSYLLNNRIRVYTCIPDVDSTKGNVVLPINEGKWVIVSLEFPQ